MAMREKILKAVNLIMDIQELNNEAEEFPYAGIDLNTFGCAASLHICENGFRAYKLRENIMNGYYVSYSLEGEKNEQAIEAAIEHLERCLERAKQLQEDRHHEKQESKAVPVGEAGAGYRV